MTEYKEVNKVSFYETIGGQDVTMSILPGLYPYTVEFVTASREVRGRKVGYLPIGEGLVGIT